jgi:glutathione S-transferase
MKLYYYPGACSMSVHICLREAGYTFVLDRVDFATGTSAGGEDYGAVNSKGYVPALRLDDGQVLTEVGVILQYLADQRPDAGLAPPAGTMERYRLMEWLNFIASEIHKTLGALFNPKITAEWRDHQIARFRLRADWLVGQLADHAFLMGSQFSIADAYLFTVLGWCERFGIDLTEWPRLRDYQDSIAARPAVRETMRAEGLTG